MIWQMFILDLLDNLPCLRLSRRHMELILWALKETGAREVPLYYLLHMTQELLQNKGPGITSKRFVTSQGNVIWLNDIPSLVAQVSACNLMLTEADTLAGLCQSSSLTPVAFLPGGNGQPSHRVLAGAAPQRYATRYVNPNVLQWAETVLCQRAG